MNNKFSKNWRWLIIISLIQSIIGYGTFILLLLAISLTITLNTAIDTSIILIFIFIVKIIVISFSLSIYILNSTKKEQIKNQYLWLFLYFLGFDIFGFIGMLLLIRNNRIEKKEINSKIVMVNNDKNILLWAIYASIGLCCFVLFAPIAIINLIKIKKQWNEKQINQDELKKIIFYSGFLVLLIGRPYTKNVILMNQE